MREILFRGKKADNVEWVKCSETYIRDGDGIWLSDENLNVVTVIPETVGQYTGLTDKNGVRIFEWDIVITKTKSCEFIGCIAYSTEYVRFVCVTSNNIPYPMDRQFKYEVIGNIHDNPELLETAAKPAAKNIAQSTLAPATENFELMEG